MPRILSKFIDFFFGSKPKPEKSNGFTTVEFDGSSEELEEYLTQKLEENPQGAEDWETWVNKQLAERERKTTFLGPTPNNEKTHEEITAPAPDKRESYNDNYWIPVEDFTREVSVRLKVKYENTRFEVYERVFDVSGFSRGDQGYHVHGYCHREKRNITISSLGMISVVDMETGEAVSNVTEFLEVKYRQAPGYLQDLLLDEYGWALGILIYLAATSGSVVKKERVVIARFAKSRPKFATLEDEWLDNAIKKLYRPGKMQVRNIVKQVVAKGVDLAELDSPISELEAMQKQENREFRTLMQYMKKQVAAQSK